MILDETQQRLRLAVIAHADDSLAKMWPATWARYAEPRFSALSPTAKSKRAVFEKQVRMRWDVFRSTAERAGERLDFSYVRLRHMACRALDLPCPYCGAAFGLTNYAIVRDEPQRGQSRAYGISNVVVCCELCADAKGDLSGDEWLEVRAALKSADPNAGQNAVVRLAAGTRALDKRKR
ncbi:MAG: hypothetical protein JWO13_2257 [Acidobacteriales bacterium]|nr:hypothetical protein [Terriglobales bacterium]